MGTVPGRRARLDRSRVVSAALEVLDEHGLAALSSHNVAQRLGVQQPALHHHFRDKADLLNAVAAEVLDRWHTECLPVAGEPWDVFLLRNARSLRRALLSVRDGALLVASTGPCAPNPGNAVKQVAFLEAAGFSGPDAVLAFISVFLYTIGSTIEEQSTPDRDAIVSANAASLKIEGLERLTAIARTVAELRPEHGFETGLEPLVRGLAP